MCGCVPKQQRFVKPYMYLVQPGDDERVIADRFGVCPCRAHELVGANLDQPLGDVGPGQVYKRFSGLTAGQKLRIPATWNNPSAYSIDGRVGEDPKPQFGAGAGKQVSPTLDQSGSLDGLANFINQIRKNAPGLEAAVAAFPNYPGIPAGQTIDTAYAVLYSWYPYLTNTFGVPGNTTVGFPYDPNYTRHSDAQQLSDLVRLMMSALFFLQQTGIADGRDPRIQNIPWDRLQWNAGWWDSIIRVGRDNGLNRVQVWQQIQDLANSVMTPYSTPPQPSYGITYGGRAPNFISLAFPTEGQEEWTSFVNRTPTGLVDYEDDLVDFLSDAGVQECLSKNPTRYVQMSGCPEVFATGGLDNFRKVLCATEPKNPCDAVKPPPPPPDEPGGTDTVKDEEETKSDNTALYMGAAAVGLLVGGIALWAAGGKD